MWFFFHSRVSKLRDANIKVACATVICPLLCICIMMRYLIVIRAHAVLLTGSRPRSFYRIACAHYVIILFSPRCSLCGPCFIYCTLFKYCSEDRFIHFLLGFCMVLITMVSKCIANSNSFSQHCVRTGITLILQMRNLGIQME